MARSLAARRRPSFRCSCASWKPKQRHIFDSNTAVTTQSGSSVQWIGERANEGLLKWPIYVTDVPPAYILNAQWYRSIIQTCISPSATGSNLPMVFDKPALQQGIQLLVWANCRPMGTPLSHVWKFHGKENRICNITDCRVNLLLVNAVVHYLARVCEETIMRMNNRHWCQKQFVRCPVSQFENCYKIELYNGFRRIPCMHWSKN